MISGGDPAVGMDGVWTPLGSSALALPGEALSPCPLSQEAAAKTHSGNSSRAGALCCARRRAACSGRGRAPAGAAALRRACSDPGGDAEAACCARRRATCSSWRRPPRRARLRRRCRRWWTWCGRWRSAGTCARTPAAPSWTRRRPPASICAARRWTPSTRTSSCRRVTRKWGPWHRAAAGALAGAVPEPPLAPPRALRAAALTPRGPARPGRALAAQRATCARPVAGRKAGPASLLRT